MNAVDLVLVRHGIALDRRTAARRGVADADRPLTRAGIERTVAAATGLAAFVRRRPVLVYTSPLLRARQTADIVAEALGAAAPSVCEALAPGGEAAGLSSVVPQSVPVAVFVGHEPDLGHLAAHLCGARPGAIPIKKAGAVVVRPAAGGGRLVAMLPPRVLRALAAGA